MRLLFCVGLGVLFVRGAWAKEEALPPFVFPAALNKVDFTLPGTRRVQQAELERRWEQAKEDPEDSETEIIWHENE